MSVLRAALTRKMLTDLPSGLLPEYVRGRRGLLAVEGSSLRKLEHTG